MADGRPGQRPGAPSTSAGQSVRGVYADQGLPGTVIECNYKGSTLDSLIRLDGGQDVLASEFFDEDDPAFDYRLGNRSALEWVLDQYQVTTDKRFSGSMKWGRPAPSRRSP